MATCYIVVNKTFLEITDPAAAGRKLVEEEVNTAVVEDMLEHPPLQADGSDVDDAILSTDGLRYDTDDEDYLLGSISPYDATSLPLPEPQKQLAGPATEPSQQSMYVPLTIDSSVDVTTFSSSGVLSGVTATCDIVVKNTFLEIRERGPMGVVKRAQTDPGGRKLDEEEVNTTRVEDGHEHPPLQGDANNILRKRHRQQAETRPTNAQGKRKRYAERSDVDEVEKIRELVDIILRELRCANTSEKRQKVFDRFRKYAFGDRVSSRAAQGAIEETQGDERILLASAFYGHVRRASSSKHANYVLQEIIKVLPPRSTQFVVKELRGVGCEAAQHPIGCRIFCRLLERGSFTDPEFDALLHEVLLEAGAMCRHAYGNYVIRHCLRYGSPQHRHMVVQSCLQDLLGNLHNEYGSRVVEDALEYSTDERDTIFAELFKHAKEFVSLAKSFSRDTWYGSVVRRLLRGKHHAKVAKCLLSTGEDLQAAKSGKALLKAIQAR